MKDRAVRLRASLCSIKLITLNCDGVRDNGPEGGNRRFFGALGVMLGAALFAAIIWLLVDIGLIFAVGMAWSHVKRRITGQLNVDDVDD
jgi:hypothetical protein